MYELICQEIRTGRYFTVEDSFNTRELKIGDSIMNGKEPGIIIGGAYIEK